MSSARKKRWATICYAPLKSPMLIWIKRHCYNGSKLGLFFFSFFCWFNFYIRKSKRRFLLTGKWLPGLLLSFVFPLAVCEWDVSVFNHVLYLSLHSDAEQHDKIHDQDRPEYRDIECIEEGAHHRHNDPFGSRMPKLKFWQSPDKRAKLFVLFCG